MADAARNGRLVAWVAASVILVLAPFQAVAQNRGMPAGGYGGRGGYGGGGFGGGAGIGLGIGGAILGGVVGSMGRQRVQEADEADEPPPRRPRHATETPARQRHVHERPKPVVEKPTRHRQPGVPPVIVRATPHPIERPVRVARPARAAPVQAIKVQPNPVAPSPARTTAKAPPPRAPARVLPATPPPVLAARTEEPGTVPGEVLIELKPNAPSDTLARLARRERLEAIETDTFSLVPLTLYRYRIRDGRAVATVVQALQTDPQIASVQANHAFTLVGGAVMAAAPPFASAQYVVAKLHLDEAHRAATGRGVLIAVIDSGVDAAHPALSGSVAESWDAIAKTAVAAGSADAHGTAVAGIVGARAQLASAAPDAQLVAIRAFSGGSAEKPGAQGTTIHVLRAIDRAASAHARVVNMSFAGPADAKLSQFLGAGTARGFVYVAAAGNAGPDSGPLYPAADPNVIAVTATDAEDKLFPTANRGAYLCVSAPGVEVFVAAPGGTYGFLSGTSMAAPQVAGIVAMMLEAKPDLTLATLREALTKSARDLGPVGPDPDYGAGLADSRDALQAVGVSFSPAAVSEAKPPLGAAEIELPSTLEAAKPEPVQPVAVTVTEPAKPVTQQDTAPPDSETSLATQSPTTTKGDASEK